MGRNLRDAEVKRIIKGYEDTNAQRPLDPS
jgi:hypothetical protein